LNRNNEIGKTINYIKLILRTFVLFETLVDKNIIILYIL